MGLRFILLVALTMSAILNATSSCFITNCPPGGKRSTLAALEPNTGNARIRQCARCGPGLSGRCFGPRVCCSDKLGCLVGTSGSGSGTMLACLAESLIPEPCINGPRGRCGREGAGVCGAPGICCFHNACHADESCQVKSASFARAFAPPHAKVAETTRDEDFYEQNLAGRDEYLDMQQRPTPSDN
ncbi:oxytocin-neurophysin 1-like [Neocloeon triangulifer]|uniref:oxytocin-neurophysin 1-like n=1 Tax=Neocloeon triangulifer TaxID=2078957 RepID=UPI00286F6F24|nr:oxytocin-neurophysin 1-like [Neocloeon triangulifer]